jgi:hypothetical protein
MRRVVLLLLLTGCPSGDGRVHTAVWSLDGALDGDRSVDDRAGGRVTCTVDSDPQNPLDSRPVLTFAAVASQDGRRQPGVYVTLHDFRGVGFYRLGTGSQENRGRAVVFDEAMLPECASPDDQRCYQAAEDCTLQLDSWDLGAVVAPGVRYGEVTGRFQCERMDDAAGERSLMLFGGEFTCRASDWTPAR